MLVVDIGGGSTELVAGVTVRRRRCRSPGRSWPAVSLDIGCVRLTERFFHHDPPLGTELAERPGRGGRRGGPGPGRSYRRWTGDGILIGLAGTVSTLAALDLGLPHYERARIHHAVLSRTEVDLWLERLATEDRHARLARPGWSKAAPT